MIDPNKGILLIANPFLKDPNFLRSSVLICDHNEEGTFGLTLSRKLEARLGEIVPELNSDTMPVYLGGPVQPDTLHFIHSYPDLFPDSEKIGEGIYWGGNFETLKIHIANGGLSPKKIKFFIGYSGWSEGQLEEEMKEDAWLTVRATKEIIFQTDPDKIWSASLNELGGDYRQLIHYPIDPQLN